MTLQKSFPRNYIFCDNKAVILLIAWNELDKIEWEGKSTDFKCIDNSYLDKISILSVVQSRITTKFCILKEILS